MSYDSSSKAPEVHRLDDQAHGASEPPKVLFSFALLATQKNEPTADKLLPSITIANGEEHHTVRVPDGKGGTKVEGMGYVPDDLTKWNQAAADKEVHHFVKVPDGHGGTKVEGMGYKPDDLTRWNRATKPEGAASSPDDLTRWKGLRDVVPHASQAGANPDGVTRVADAGQPESHPAANSTDIVINSGAGSRAQLFNRGPRIEQKVTVAPPADVPAPGPPADVTKDVPKNVPEIVPYDGPGSRAQLFRHQEPTKN